MRVLIVGGTGFIGTSLAAELHERGHEVTVLSRDPADADLPTGIGRVAGDVTDYDAIEGAFEGQDAVVYLVALSPLFKTPRGLTHEEVHLGGAENVVRAAEEHGVRRIVHTSGIHTDPDAPTAYLRAKGEAEAVVRESDLEWVIVRPTMVFGDGDEIADFVNLVTTPYVTGLPGGGRVRYQPMWVEDLAPMLADAVEDDERAGDTYEVGGPEVLTLAEMTRLVHRARGRSVAILPVPTALAKVGLRVMDPVPGFPLGTDQAKSMDTDLTVEDNAIEAFGVDPDTMRTYADYLGVEGDESPAGDGKVATVPAAILGVGAWAVAAVALLLAGLLAGVWVPDDVTRADSLVWDFGALFLVGTVVLAGGPVFASLRFRLAAPLATLAVYVGYWVVWALLNGVGVVRILYVAALYEWLAIPVIAVAAVLEYLARSLLGGRRSSVA